MMRHLGGRRLTPLAPFSFSFGHKLATNLFRTYHETPVQPHWEMDYEQAIFGRFCKNSKVLLLFSSLPRRLKLPGSAASAISSIGRATDS